MIGIEFERGLAALLLAKAEKSFDRRMAMGSVFPLTGCAPFELRRLGRIGQRLAGGDQSLNVHAIIDRHINSGHRSLLHDFTNDTTPRLWRVRVPPAQNETSLRRQLTADWSRRRATALVSRAAASVQRKAEKNWR